MNSALKTLIEEKHHLEIELKIWSDPRNLNHEVLGIVQKEIKEHDEAIEVLKKDNLEKLDVC